MSLAEVKATGPQGAITERDVRAYVDEAKAEVEAEQALASTLTSASVAPVARRIAEDAGGGAASGHRHGAARTYDPRRRGSDRRAEERKAADGNG